MVGKKPQTRITALTCQVGGGDAPHDIITPQLSKIGSHHVEGPGFAVRKARDALPSRPLDWMWIESTPALAHSHLHAQR